MKKLLAVFAIFVLVACGGGGSDSAPGKQTVYLSMGDSITFGWGASKSYVTILSETTGKTFINAGIDGELSGGGASRIDALLAEHKPDAVTIYYGTNDSGFYSFEYTRWNLEYMVNAAKTAGAQVYIATLQPAFAPWAWRQPFMMEISAIVRNIAAENAVTFVDLEAAFNWNSSLIGADGLHPNDAGQQLIATVFRSSIPGL